MSIAHFMAAALVSLSAASTVRATGARSVTSHSAVLTVRTMVCDPCRWQWRWRRIGASRWTRSRTYRGRRVGRLRYRVGSLHPDTLYRYRFCLTHARRMRCVGKRWVTKMVPPFATIGSGGGGGGQPLPTPVPGAAPPGPVAAWRLGANGPGFTPQGGVGGVGMQQAAAAGLGVMRAQLIEGSSSVLTAQMDDTVATYARDGLTVYPILGISLARKGPTYMEDSAALDVYVAAFAGRFGPGGSFWTEHPELQAHPITQFEIGNEPNTVPPIVADETNLHYSSPAAFAYVYAHARAAIKAVNPNARVIVGGIAPFSLPSDQLWLYSFLQSSGPVDAVGWHPYVGLGGNSLPTLADLYSWTLAFRAELNNVGFASTGLDVNEFDSDLQFAGSSAAWGAAVAAFTRWAICTPSAGVVDVQPEWWGGKAGADANLLLPLAHDDGSLSDYGRAYLAEAHELVSTGCPA